MPHTALLRVDASGVVSGANDVAERVLGPCVGQRCCTLVAALGPDARVHCTEGCAASLVAHGGTTAVTRTTVGGVPSALSCSGIGDEVVVAIHHTTERTPDAPLTPRELQVIGLVAEGLTNRRIARRLGISMSTVRTHMERILDKLDTRSRAAAVTEAIATGQLLRS